MLAFRLTFLLYPSLIPSVTVPEWSFTLLGRVDWEHKPVKSYVMSLLLYLVFFCEFSNVMNINNATKKIAYNRTKLLKFVVNN